MANKSKSKPKRKPKEDHKDYHLYPAVQVRLIPEIKELLENLTELRGNQTSIISLAIRLLYERTQDDPTVLEASQQYERSTRPQFTRGIRKPRPPKSQETVLESCN